LLKGLKVKSKEYLGLLLILAIYLLPSEYALAAKINWAGEWRHLESSKYYYATIKIAHVTRIEKWRELFKEKKVLFMSAPSISKGGRGS
jgi:hypothetical protein